MKFNSYLIVSPIFDKDQRVKYHNDYNEIDQLKYFPKHLNISLDDKHNAGTKQY